MSILVFGSIYLLQALCLAMLLVIQAIAVGIWFDYVRKVARNTYAWALVGPILPCDFVPDGHWEKMMELIKKMPQLPPDDHTFDPDPLA